MPAPESSFHQGLVNRQLGAGIDSRVILRIRNLFRDRAGVSTQLNAVDNGCVGQMTGLEPVLVLELKVISMLAHHDADELASQILLAQDGGTLAQPAPPRHGIAGLRAI